MALADPQSLTIAGTAVSLPRTSVGPDTSTYTSSDGMAILTAAHQYGKRTRRTLRLQHKKVASDPLLAGQSVPVNMTTYIVVDTPLTGYTVAQQKEVVDALVAYLSASTGAKVTQLLGGEN